MLGNQFAILTPNLLPIAAALWLLGLGLWLILIYTFFTVVTVREPKPAFEGRHQWLVAARRRVHGIDRRAGDVGRQCVGQPATCPVHIAGDVPHRGAAVYSAYHTDSVSLDVLQHEADGTYTALLDQYGGTGDLDVGGIAFAVDREGLGFLAGRRAFHPRLDAVVLVHGDVVDSAAGHRRHLAASRGARAAALRSAILGHGLSARHVYRGDVCVDQSHEPDHTHFIPRLFVFVALLAWLLTFLGLARQMFASRARAA